jgi:anthranilate synthase component I
MKYKFKTEIQEMLSDTFTPVQLYYQLRDKYVNALLLESSDHKSKQNSYSYICINAIASVKVQDNKIEKIFPDAITTTKSIFELNVIDEINHFIECFESDELLLDFISTGFFGFTSYDAIPLFEDIKFKSSSLNNELPLLHYQFFKNIIVFDHYYNKLYCIDHTISDEETNLNEIINAINNRAIVTHHFATKDNEISNYTDSDFLNLIEKGKQHCAVGDVFQLVLSRKFQQQFKGDEFNLYRALRSINPSPYLFYFDYGHFKIFGSSPEAQLIINHQKATIHPIAGTFKRTGNADDDNEISKALLADPKENAEHVMLVDLARNDLSKHSNQVEVEKFKEVEYYSHVIHLVSKVTAALSNNYNPIALLADTFPAGTLSGAPKYKAMSLIDEYENSNRGFYGGTIGFIGLNKTLNHAIFIRSFLSYQNTLTYQAGCGIVAKSDNESELHEINNKISALRKAIELAKEI